MTVVYVPAPSGNDALDTFRLQIALNCVPNQGGIIYCSAGAAYTLTRTLYIRNNITFDLNGAILTAADSLNNALIRTYHPNLGNANITIRNGTLEGNSANQSADANSAHGISLWNTSGVTVEKVIGRDFRRDFVYIGGRVQVDGITSAGGCDGVIIRDCEAHDCHRNGISVTGGTNVRIDGLMGSGCNISVEAGFIDLEPNTALDAVQYIDIGRVHITASHAPAIAIQRSSGTKADIHIHDFEITQSGGDAAIIGFDTISNVTIEDGSITNVGGVGIFFAGQSFTVSDVIVRRNTITGNDSANRSGVGGTQVTRYTITENTIADCNPAVLVGVDCDTVQVTDNTFASCANGVDVNGGAVNVTQSGNTGGG